MILATPPAQAASRVVVICVQFAAAGALADRGVEAARWAACRDLAEALLRHEDVEVVLHDGAAAVRRRAEIGRGWSLSRDDLRQHCVAMLARFKAPTSIEFREVLARTATGKLQKFKLRAPYWEGRDRQVN